MQTTKKTRTSTRSDHTAGQLHSPIKVIAWSGNGSKVLWSALALRNFMSVALVVMLAAIPSAGSTKLEGLVINKTNRKAPTGDDVVLLSLSQEGMTESSHSRTDNRGRFTLPVPDPELTHVVRVSHEGVTYHQIVEPGTKRVAIVVYDVAKQVDGVSAVMDVERFEATSDTLEVKQLVTIRNDSHPPRTLMSDRSFEIQLPSEAVVESGLVQVAEDQPLKQKPVAGDQKGQYYFSFPLRPGDTRFAVVYRLPYEGSAIVQPHLRNQFEKFAVMLPKAMKFNPETSGIFHSMPNTTPDNVQGTDAVTSEKSLAFRISGAGMLEELKGRRQEAQNAKANSAASGSSPGGGLGPPVEGPDPLQNYRWPILVGILVLTSVGAMYVIRRAGGIPSADNQARLQPVHGNGSNKRSRGKARRRVRERVQV